MSSNTESDLLANKYQQKTDKAHILDNPDTYIGSVEEVQSTLWVLEESSSETAPGPRIVPHTMNYIPGLFKLFDEGIVNCRDHVVRCAGSAHPVTHIDVTVCAETGRITLRNDGQGIDVAMHPEHQMWIPEMIFGHLRTSTNYDKTEKKIVGGKNGFGFKLVLIWSTEGSVETVDATRGLKYTQTFRQNLDVIEPPTVTKCKTKPYTQVSFVPDYARLGLPLPPAGGLSLDMQRLLKRRVVDIAALTDKSVKVRFNDVAVPVRGLTGYLEWVLGDAPRAYEAADNGRWEVAVALSPEHAFQEISFVNGIHTSKGGKHVDYIVHQLTRKLGEYIEKKKKVKVNPQSIKEQLFVLLRCDIENPAFDSQTKDYLNTPSSKFGSTFSLSDKLVEKVAKMGVMDMACALTEMKETKAAKKTDGAKVKNLRGIPKLMDANWAGTERSSECMILFCEGDSAKAGIVSGLSAEDRNTIGVYPLKGKIMNVRGELAKKINDNQEISDLKKILGLESGRDYVDLVDAQKSLRYGRVLFMTDQDLDGSHIKGLCLNLFACEWPSLFQLPGFIGFMNTPILKARKGQEERVFYNQGEYETWKQSVGEAAAASWHIKYYKGLGTSTGKEFREYFANKKVVGFTPGGEVGDAASMAGAVASSHDILDRVFNKKRADDRKHWLENYQRDLYLDTNRPLLPYPEFIDREFIHFSKYDCDRSIPNLMDGLKISLRKILFAAFKKRLHSEIKVAQFSGYVSEHAGYHHGEASLNAAIVGLAQNFVGSNNLPLFVPSGQFGTRMRGGKDSASERYIYTYLQPLTRQLFPEADDAVLTYLEDDGQKVEPVFYAPILPLLLVNGSKGIGTGFSTEVLSYHPLQLANYLRHLLVGGAEERAAAAAMEWVPYYEGFTGTLTAITKNKFGMRGCYTKVGVDKVRITELPVGVWTQDFKEMLEELMSSAVVKDYDDQSKDTTVDFTVTLARGKLEELEAAVTMTDGISVNGVERLLKLYTTLSCNNMHLFDAQDKLRKFDSVPAILDAYFGPRLALYHARKAHQLEGLAAELRVLSNRVRYLQETLAGTVDLRRRTHNEVMVLLEGRGYDALAVGEHGAADYKYLTKMPMDSVTQENVERMIRDHTSKEAAHAELLATSAEQLWMRELDVFCEAYQTQARLRAEAAEKEARGTTTGGATSKKTTHKKAVVVKK